MGTKKLRILSDRFGTLASTVLCGVSALASTAPLPARNETDIFDIVCFSVLQGFPVHSERLFSQDASVRQGVHSNATSTRDENGGMTGKECKVVDGYRKDMIIQKI